MANKILMPHLSNEGWIKDSVKIADIALSHFFLAEASQSYIYDGHVTSFPFILQDTQGKMTQTLSDTRNALNTYFSRFFNNVVVETRDDTDPNEPSKGIMTIYLSFTDSDGNNYSLGQLIKFQDLKVNEIIKINNG